MQERTFNTKTVAILILALGVRLLGIISRPIWYDEAFSILFSEKGLSAAIAPFKVHYAQDIGMHVFLAIWLLLATYAYLRGSRSEDWKRSSCQMLQSPSWGEDHH